MAQKKLVKVNFGVAQDLENQIIQGGKLYNEISMQLGQLGKLISVMQTTVKKGQEVAFQINQNKTILTQQLKELGLKESDVPSISKAIKFGSSFEKLREEVNAYIR